MLTSAEKMALEALSLARKTPPIKYVRGGKTLTGMDCQGLIAYCAEKSGVKAGWTDSNMLARRWVVGQFVPIKQAGGYMRGWLGLILEPVGARTPARYAKDAFADMYGDCSHVGIITQEGLVWSVDASASAGVVRTRDERNARLCWTHVARLKGVEYAGVDSVTVVKRDKGVLVARPPEPLEPDARDEPDAPGARDARDEPDAPIQPPVVSSAWFYAVVDTPNLGPLNLRRAPTMQVDNRVGTALFGDKVAVLERRNDGWSKVSYMGITAYAQTMYLRTEEATR